MRRVVIVAAGRTPFGRFRGGLSEQTPQQLAAGVAESLLRGLQCEQIDQCVIGNVLSAGHGMNIARQVVRMLGLPLQTPGTTINMMCGSGLQSVSLAATAIRAGEARVVLCGGTESMSKSPLAISRPGKGAEADAAGAVDLMLCDGLQDPESGEHMGVQTERLAARFGISRKAQDAYAIRSQRLFARALQSGRFCSELVACETLEADEHPRAGVQISDLQSLRPIFAEAGSVTAGNASGINDGAAILIVCDAEYAAERGWKPLCEWVDAVVVGCDPSEMGLGPVHAIRALMSRQDLHWSQIDRLEINEAFAAQTLACLQSLELQLVQSGEEADEAVTTADGTRVAFNACGGAIATGHPLAASGARIAAHLAQEISAGVCAATVASLCIGGGMGIAALLRKMP